MRGSLFPAAFAMAGPCALISFLLKWYGAFQEHEILLNPTAWSQFSSLVGFLVVFRTSEAYSRFWDGCTATHQMRAEWIDAASAIMAFCRHSDASEEQIINFKHLTVRLFSLLHAMALGEIEECEDLGGMVAYNLELIDPCGLDKESWRSLKQCHNKVTLVFTWLQTAIVENIKTGVLSIPAPILSRVFQELANGMVALHEAQKISNIPFPFPYAQTCDLLLFIHWIITPIVTSRWAAQAWSAAVFGFMQVFILWALNNIAVEIEHPFGNDANDLDASQMQLDMNMSLLLVLHPAATRAPQLAPEAQIHGLVNMGRGASQAINKLQSFSYYDVIGSGHAEETTRRSMQAAENNAFWTASMDLEPGQLGGDVANVVVKEAAPLEVIAEPPCVAASSGRSQNHTHMDPIVSLPIAQRQQGDMDPAPVQGTPRQRLRGDGVSQPLVQVSPGHMGLAGPSAGPPQTALHELPDWGLRAPSSDREAAPMGGAGSNWANEQDGSRGRAASSSARYRGQQAVAAAEPASSRV